MEELIDKLVDVLLWAGVGILILVVGAFWLFHALKKDAERRDKLEAESRTDD